MKTKTHLYEKSGHVFYNVTSTKVDYTLSGLRLRLDNLFEGVKVLGKYKHLNNYFFVKLLTVNDNRIYFCFFLSSIETEDSTNQYLNENWRPVSDALKPILAKTIEDILLVILNKVFHFIPADYLISDIPRPSQLYG